MKTPDEIKKIRDKIIELQLIEQRKLVFTSNIRPNRIGLWGKELNSNGEHHDNPSTSNPSA